MKIRKFQEVIIAEEIDLNDKEPSLDLSTSPAGTRPVSLFFSNFLQKREQILKKHY